MSKISSQIFSEHRQVPSLTRGKLSYKFNIRLAGWLLEQFTRWPNVPSSSSSALRRRHLRVAGRSNEENWACEVLLKIGAQLACTMIIDSEHHYICMCYGVW